MSRDSRNKFFEENARNPFADPKIPGFGIGKNDNNFVDSNVTMWNKDNTAHLGMQKRYKKI